MPTHLDGQFFVSRAFPSCRALQSTTFFHPAMSRAALASTSRTPIVVLVFVTTDQGAALARGTQMGYRGWLLLAVHCSLDRGDVDANMKFPIPRFNAPMRFNDSRNVERLRGSMADTRARGCLSEGL